MSRMVVRVVLLAMCVAGAPVAVAQEVVVTPEVARFRIPVGRQVAEHWRWYQKETVNNHEEYHWQARIEGDSTYWVGFALFKFPGVAPREGAFAELLAAGQAHVAIASARGASVIRRVAPALRGEGDMLVVELRNPQMIARLFAKRPLEVTLESQSPYQARSQHKVRVVYESASSMDNVPY